MSDGPFEQYRETPLWSALESIVAELVATSEVTVNTAPAYVVGFVCRELAAKKLIAPSALEK